MKRLIGNTILFYSIIIAEGQANGFNNKGFKNICPIPEDYKLQLIKSMPYNIQDIICTENNTYRWIIQGPQWTNKIRRSKKNKATKDLNVAQIRSNKVIKEIKAIAKNFRDKKQVTEPTRMPAKIDNENFAPKMNDDQSNFSKDEFHIGINYGIDFLSYTQEGVLGEIDISTLLNGYTIFSSYERESFSISSQFDLMNFNYTQDGKSKINRLMNYKLKAAYHGLFIAGETKQLPLLKNTSSGIEFTVESLTFIKLGYQWNFLLNSKKQTKLLIDLSYSHLAGGNIADTSISSEKYDGSGVEINATFTRNLKDKDSSISYYWSNGISNKNLERTVDWESSVGKVNNNFFQVNTVIGLQLNF